LTKTAPSTNNSKKIETITLDDGRVLTLKPLKITPLRRFMVRFQDLTHMEEYDELLVMDIVVDCAATALRTQLPDETDYLKKEIEDRTVEDRDAFGELLDMEDVTKVNREMGGVAFGNPNLPTETLTETPTAPTAAEEDGTT